MAIYPSIMYKKKQIASEGLCRAHLECVSEWQGMWLYVETSINTKFCNMNGVLCGKSKKKLVNLRNPNTIHKKAYIRTYKLYTCMKDVREKV